MKAFTKIAMAAALAASIGACGNSLETWAQFEDRCPAADRVSGMGLAMSGAAATVCRGDPTADTSGGNPIPAYSGTAGSAISGVR